MISLYSMRLLLAITLPFYVLDQLTKWLVLRSLAPGEGRVVIANFFDLYHTTNTGAAFSMLSGANWLFIILSAVTLAVLAWYAWRGAFTRWNAVAVALLTSGILGNLTDRILRGHVIDFISIDLHVPFASPWPTFNIADSAICVAVVILVALSFRQPAQS